MSSSVWPESLRNFSKSAALGNASFFCLSKDFLTSASETLMPFAFGLALDPLEGDQQLQHLVAQRVVLLLALRLELARR